MARLLFLCSFLFLSSIEAKTPLMHVLLVGDSADKIIGDDVKVDLSRMRSSLAAIARTIGYEHRITTLKEKKASVTHIKKWFLALPKNSSDIVFFFYTGHGSRDIKEKRWPVLDMKKRGQLASMAIIRFLRKRPQKFAAVLINACNSADIQRHEPPLLGERRIAKSLVPIVPYTISLPGIKTLFLHPKEMLIATSSQPGEDSFSGYEDEVAGISSGGDFTTSFLLALQECCRKKEVTWQEVFDRISTLVENQGQNQHPIFKIEQTASYNK